MILALEAADSLRLTCSECTPELQKRRGCQKPGFSIPLGGPPFRFDSPALQPPPGSKQRGFVLYECPTGYTIREAFWVYSMIEAAARDENLSPAERERMSPLYHSAVRVFNAERERARQKRARQYLAARDAAPGAAVRAGRA